jgi:hypothetical protein
MSFYISIGRIKNPSAHQPTILHRFRLELPEEATREQALKEASELETVFGPTHLVSVYQRTIVKVER